MKESSSVILEIGLILFFFAWGSFLNVVAHRLIQGGWRVVRSQCPSCKHTLFWYDTVPVVSFCMLQGKCRYCFEPISWLYPAIEIATALVMLLGYYVLDDTYFIGFFTFFSALIVTIRTDLEHMLISQWVTLAMIPVGIVFAFLDWIPTMPLNSIAGAAAGYCIPFIIGKLFRYITQKDGIGEGDFELLACIGAFTGIMGAWFSLCVGSFLGAIAGMLYIWISKKSQRDTPIPFGPFLAVAAIIYSLLSEQINMLFFGSIF